jgi:hypothetical protein
MGRVDLKDQVLQLYLLEREKKTKWYMKMFRILLNVTILNCLLICRANSGQSQTDHFKFTVDLVQALLIEQGREIDRKVQGCHFNDKKCHNFLKDISPKESHQQTRRPGQRRGV